MRFGSVCSGIEAASVAWHPLEWQAAWLAEIEPFPSAVLAHHYPDVPNLGDMTTLPDRILRGEVEAPDLFCGGTPCQAFSVAGLRKSLDDARGNLSLTFCEIANAIDTIRAERGHQPAVVFWENVPGVLSTKDNAFGCFLAGIAGEDNPLEPAGGKWTNAGYVLGPKRAVAWRVLDAQYFGVAQRRKRVFVVASARDDFDPAAVLFEFDGLRRDTAPSRQAGQEVAAGTGERTTERSHWDGDYPHPTLNQSAKGSGGVGASNQEIFSQRGAYLAPEISQTFSCAGIGAYTNDNAAAILLKSGQDLGNGCEALVAQTFDFQSSSEYGTAPVPITMAQPYTLAIRGRGDTHQLEYRQDGTANALLTPNGGRGGIGVGAVAFQPRYYADRVRMGGEPSEICHALSAAAGQGDSSPHVATAMAVRRLTPVECERLQGFPDTYTQIPWRKKPASECPDGPRYKALGNSWAVPVVRWIGRRVDDQIIGGLV